MLPFETQLAEQWPPERWRNECVIVGVSGGADSVALLRALVALHETSVGRGRLVVAHFHHGLRGEESTADKQFVRDYLETVDWNKQPPAPALPTEIVNATTSRYLEAYRILTESSNS